MSREISEDNMRQLLDALMQGRKIYAIKLHRQFTGSGLKEAKEEIEEIEASFRSKFPDKFKAAPQGKGCLGAAAVVCFCGLAAVYWFLKA
jgi:ribosomal protein L7/L12